MGNKMLIDATHPEETRVVVTRGNRVEEFDYESASRKQLRGNIYLAKVARIEPSLQAAFVNYGGNRHGFLAFAEIHPDYYQIPVAVREALMKEEALDRQGSHDTNDGGESEPKQDAAIDAPSAEPLADEHDAAASLEQAAVVAEASPVEERVASADAQAAVPAEARVDREPAKPEEQAEVTSPEAKAGDGHEHEEQPAGRDGLIALEGVLPPTVYGEFAAAMERAEEARDEIPAHPDDVEEEPAPSDGGPVEVENDAAAEHAAEDEHAPWENGTASGEGGVISVPEPPIPTPVEVVGSEDALEELPQRHKRRWRHYKIQEVIKRNQIVLVQVVKEERGSKGAALTTYLSLAGRYTVLMPNTASGGGISRKITVPADRKRLKEIAQELDVPEGMGLIIRTAGASRTKAEIKRDFEYLLRLWENVRDLTLKSTAPCLVYEEGDLIKRSIRDLYNKDIDEILVAGDDSHRDAKEFMRMLMPSHAKNVLLYKDPEPLFIKYEVERQLNQMFSPVVTLRSGGYIVLNQTEALVAIDVNSGRATREYSIEDTALKTNLEAAEEVARQVRLRDLAGLIVIDFIDMDERRNNRAVERKIKESLRHDRARIQVGHISHFGLLEMSRQRLRQGVVEVSTMPCPVCQGVGHIRSTESVALMILRSLEDHLRTQGPANITVSASTEAALYILNHKRSYLRDIEIRYGVTIVIQFDEKAHGAHFSLERGAEAVPPVVEQKAVHMDAATAADLDDEEEEGAEGDDKRPSRRKRRRRRGRGEQGYDSLQNGAAAQGLEANGDDRDDEEDEAEIPEILEVAAPPAEAFAPTPPNGAAELESESAFRRGRRRGRRGGRRHREDGLGPISHQPGYIPGLGDQPVGDFDHGFAKGLQLGPISPQPAEPTPAQSEPAATQVEPVAAEAQSVPAQTAVAETPPAETVVAEAPPVAPLQSAPPPVEIAAAASQEAVPSPETVQPPVEEAAPAEPVKAEEPAPAPEPKPKPVRTGPARTGWWQRRSV
jgi:ribonuclease E